MNTRRLPAGAVLAVGVALVGLGLHSATAQGQKPKSLVMDNCDRMIETTQGQTMTYTLQGNVRLRHLDGSALDLTAAPDGFVLQIGSSQGKSQVIKIPMDMATLRVSVTPAGTVFTDGKSDRLTVEAAAPAP